MDEQQLITQANETFEKLGLVNAKEYAIFKGIKPASIYNKLHSKNIVKIGGFEFYKTREI